MSEHKAILRAVAALVCATAIFTVQARGQVGETFRIEAGKEGPHCAEDSSSPLCQAEQFLAFHFPRPDLPDVQPLIIRLMDWLFGVEKETDTSTPNPARVSVVVPVIIDYHVVELRILDATDIEFLPSRWHDHLSPLSLEPGAVRIELLVAFEDAHGMRWPTKEWQRHEYLLTEPDDTRGLTSEGGFFSREINLRWASSDCIGKPDTPLCAVETLLACRVRRDDALCAQVTDSVSSDARWASGVTYFVSAIDAVEDESLPSGHKYAVTLEESDIYRDFGNFPYGDREFTRYDVVRSDDGWRVVERTVFIWKAPQDVR
jgi:hypothetical protein